jgi:hypothetical protein
VTSGKGRKESEQALDQAASPPPGRDPSRLEAYNAVIERAALSSVRLIDLSFRVRGDLESKCRVPVSAFYDAIDGGHVFNAQTGRAVLNLTCVAGARRGKKSLVECKAVFAVTYEGLEGCEEAAVGRFLARVGRFAGYPYFRSLFSVLTWHGETGMPPLPVLKEFPKPPPTPPVSEPKQSAVE